MTDVVVFSPHADDETLGMGGSIARYVADGFSVVVICCAWHQDRNRYGEFENACAVLGAVPEQLIFEGELFDDGHLSERPATLIAAMDAVLEKHKPKDVYLPYPSPHQDHRAVYECGIAASRVSLNPAHWWVRNLLVYGEAVAELQMYPSGLSWNHWVDIEGDPLERKLMAIDEYKTQNMDLPYPSNKEYLVAEAVQAGGSAMMVAAEQFAVIRWSK